MFGGVRERAGLDAWDGGARVVRAAVLRLHASQLWCSTFVRVVYARCYCPNAGLNTVNTPTRSPSLSTPDLHSHPGTPHVREWECARCLPLTAVAGEGEGPPRT